MATSRDPTPNTLRRAAEQGNHRSGLRALVFLCFAIATALGGAFLLNRYVDAKAARAEVPTVKVVVAAIEVPLATTLHREAMTTVDWPSSSKPEGALADLNPLIGRVVITHVAKGEPILEGKLASNAAGNGLAAVLPPNMRAVAVRVDDVVGVAGFIHPGDFVDVIVTMKPRESGDALPTSKIILQTVKVLAVGKEVDEAKKKHEGALSATVATLMVDSEQSEKLALAAAKGQLLLSLRSAIDTEEVTTSGVVPPVLLAGAGQAPPAAEREKPAAEPPRRAGRVAAAAVRKPPPEPSESVEILRGDLFEKRQFQNPKQP